MSVAVRERISGVRAEPGPGLAVARIVPPPPKRIRPAAPIQWAIGISTAPRRNGAYYLDQTVASIREAGWEDGLVDIFAEPGSKIPDGFNGAVNMNGRPRGTFPNQFNGLHSLVFGRETCRATALIMLEDDVRLCPGLRDFLERFVLWPVEPQQLGCISLYTCAIYGKSAPGWYEWSRPRFWGAQALMWSKEAAIQYLKTPFADNRLENRNIAANDFSDGQVSAWASAMGRSVRFAVGVEGASLVEHIGEVSSVFEYGNEGGRRHWWSVGQEMRGEQRPKEECPYSPNGRSFFAAPGITNPAPPTWENSQARAARRLEICQKCDAWVGPDSHPEQKHCSACACATPRTADKLGTLGIACPRGLPGWE